MRITDSVIEELKSKAGLKIRNRLANDLFVSGRTVDRWIVANHKNLRLPESIKIISEETGLAIEEILEDSVPEVAQK